MRTLLTTLAVLLSVPASAVPGPQINGNQINPQSGINISTLNVTGTQGLAVTGPASAASFSGSGSGLTSIPAGTALTGQVPIANGGTNLSSAGGTANRVLRTSDGSTFAMGQVIGPDVAASTVPLSSLNQSGASDQQVVLWSASAGKWVASAAPGGISGLTSGFVPRSSGATSIVNGNMFETSTGTSINLPFTATGQVHISSGFVNNFLASAFSVSQTALNTAATVTGSTGSFVVQGSTVECWVAGAAEASASGNGMIATITVDGSATAIPGTSSTVGAFSCTSGASTPNICPIKDRIQFQVTAGSSHTFVLFMWMISSTATWPGSHNVGQFGCREVPSR
jgi:hypothetical protein